MKRYVRWLVGLFQSEDPTHGLQLANLPEEPDLSQSVREPAVKKWLFICSTFKQVICMSYNISYICAFDL